MLKKWIVVLIGVLFFGGSVDASNNCDVVCKTLKHVSSPYSVKNLYDILIEKKVAYEKLLKKGYKKNEAINIIKFQPNNLGFNWVDAIRISALGVKDLYFNSIVDGWTISNATFLQSYYLLKKASDYDGFLSIKNFLNFKNKIKDFSLIVKGIVAENELFNIKGKTQKFVNALDNFTENYTLSIDDLKAIIEYLDAVIKVLMRDNPSSVTYSKEFSTILNSLKELEDYDKFKDYLSNQKLNENILVSLLTAKDILFIKSYYHIKKLKITLSIINIIAEYLKEKKVVGLNLKNIIKSIGIDYKYITGLSGIEPTFNQNFSYYAKNSIAIYKQDIHKIIETYKVLKQKMDKLIYKYASGQKMTGSEIEKLVTLYNKYGMANNFSNYVVSRYLKQHKKLILEKIIYTNVINNAKINLPLIGEIYNATLDDAKKLTLQIWGKDGKNILSKKLTYYDVSSGNYEGYNTIEIGDTEYGIKIKFDKNNAFYDKNGNFYYYKYGLFDENMNMIYVFINQNDGGYAPGWDYNNKNNKILLEKNGDIKIKNAFGIIPFYIDEIGYKNKQKFNNFVKYTGENKGDLKDTYHSLIQYATSINKYNNKNLSKWLSKRFDIDENYLSKNIMNKDKYLNKDILYIKLNILKYIYQHSSNSHYRTRSKILLMWINKLIHNKRLVTKYGIDSVLLHAYKLRDVTNLEVENLNKVLKIGVFKREMFKLYKFLRRKTK